MEINLTTALLLKQEIKEKIQSINWPKLGIKRPGNEAARKELDARYEKASTELNFYKTKLDKVQAIIDQELNKI